MESVRWNKSVRWNRSFQTTILRAHLLEVVDIGLDGVVVFNELNVGGAVKGDLVLALALVPLGVGNLEAAPGEGVDLLGLEDVEPLLGILLEEGAANVHT